MNATIDTAALDKAVRRFPVMLNAVRVMNDGHTPPTPIWKMPIWMVMQEEQNKIDKLLEQYRPRVIAEYRRILAKET